MCTLTQKIMKLYIGKMLIVPGLFMNFYIQGAQTFYYLIVNIILLSMATDVNNSVFLENAHDITDRRC